MPNGGINIQQSEVTILSAHTKRKKLCLSGSPDILCGECLKNDVTDGKSSLQRGHSMLNGELYKGWKIFDAQLLHQPATVGFYGFGR